MKVSTIFSPKAFAPFLTASLLISLSARPLAAEQPIKVGPEFEVNTHTLEDQRLPAVALRDDGSFVIAWASETSPGTDADGYSLIMRRFDSTGAPTSTDQQVNTSTNGDQHGAAAAFRQDGGFVLVWHSDSSVGDDQDLASIQMQRYDSGGSPVGGEVQVNTYTTGRQLQPRIARGTDDSFLVVWRSDATGHGIRGQRLDANGDLLGDEMEVSQYNLGNQHRPALAAMPDGDFVVVWDGTTANDGNSYGIAARMVDPVLGPIDDDLAVNTYTTGGQREATVSADALGRFTVVWSSDTGVGDDLNRNIRARYFHNLQAPLDDDFQVDTLLEASVFRPRSHGTSAGEVFVTWESNISPGDDSSSLSVLGRYFVPDGRSIRPVDLETQVNTYTSSIQANPAVATGAGDTALAVWNTFSSPDVDRDGTSIRAQHFELGLIFSDGFESGSAEFWSTSHPN